MQRHWMFLSDIRVEMSNIGIVMECLAKYKFPFCGEAVFIVPDIFRMYAGKQKIGYKAEENALSFLTGKGLTLVERNFHCRFGEIDLIMRDGETLVFVEVRKRKNRSFGGAVASVSAEKQRKLVKTANMYLLGCRHMPLCRFDVVAFDGDDCQWLKNVIEVN